MSFINYQPQPYNPNQDYMPLPEGYYRVSIEEIKECTSKETATYPGVKYIAFKMIVADGDFKGRYLIENININCPNEKARLIAHRTLDGIAYALKTTSFDNPELLTNRPFKVKVTIKDSYNRIKKYHHIDDALTDENKTPIINHKVKQKNGTAISMGDIQPPTPSISTFDDCPF